MAVYTQVSAEDMAALLSRYDAGTLVSAKGIAEGVENSNYLVETTRSRFILTLYEKRVDAGDLPFFMALLDHVADKGLPVPRAIRDRDGVQLQTVAGRSACLIEFLPGVSVSHPTHEQAYATGAALGRLHEALADFAGERPNTLGAEGRRELAGRCGDALDTIAPGLGARVAAEIAWQDANLPADLPQAVIHADLFPDNVLMLGSDVTGLIDFYFACRDIRAWDLAVTHSAWCFDADGSNYSVDRAHALVAGYDQSFGLSGAERAAFRALARASCLRFLLTRAWDWLNTPADAMVTRKDPLAYLRRLDFYASAEPDLLLG
ncbi:homoserine kinase [Sphingomonas sp. ID0503]|uniref:homoserine kinase n=1 Tax=Sphingomonas sp. ID0503 TaxID=3399691 RepID=UPI003AFAA0D0